MRIFSKKNNSLLPNNKELKLTNYSEK